MKTLAILAFAFVLAFRAEAQDLAPRRPLPKSPVALAPVPPSLAAPERRLIVKFADAVRARARADGELASAAGVDLASAVRGATAASLRFRPLIPLPQERLDALEARAAARSGVAQPDLAGMLIVELSGARDDDLVALGEALQRLPEVEFAYLQTLGVPPPEDIPPTTPNHVGQQGYRGPNPGIDADYAWTLGLRGAGIRFSDCEYGWNPAHEDLVDTVIHPEPGQTPVSAVPTYGWDEHGTAVLGETSAVVNAYGCSGMIPDAEIHTFPEWTVEGGKRRVAAITSAIAGSSAGDVVLLEMQTVGAGWDYGPAELDPAVWTVCKTGTDAGVVVVGAAGNGNQDLDSAPYAPYMAYGDSGAIIVGAGTSDTGHHKLSFSTFGSRVNLQGWGYNTFSLGYGTAFVYGGDKNQRYTWFAGTSSASPMVAAACVALQERALQQLGAPLSPHSLRALLVQTGIPQGSGGHIGPLPNLKAALEGMCPAPATYCSGKLNSQGCVPSIVLSGVPQLGASSGFVVTGIDVVADKMGLTFYSLSGADNLPFHNGTLCVMAPLIRVGPPIGSGSSGAGSCAAGVLAFDYNAILSSAAVSAGASVWAQIWYRDPTIDGFGDGFTDAVAFELCP